MPSTLSVTAVANGLVGILTDAERNTREGRRRINQARDLYGNDDSVSWDRAHEAYCAGRPAFWTTAGYGSARAFDLPLAINAGASIVDAVTEAYPDRLYLTGRRLPALDTLVPLNFSAAVELAKAYEAFGSFRDLDELEDRRVREMRRAA